MTTGQDTASDSSIESERFAFQLRMLEEGAKAIQHHIERIDDILFKAKASAVTVWVAIVGWGFSSGNSLLIPLGFVVALGFWLLEGYFRGLQARYLISSSRLTCFFGDENQIQSAFDALHLPDRIVYPMAFEETALEKIRMYLKGLMAPSVATTYLFLGFVNYLLWLAIGSQ